MARLCVKHKSGKIRLFCNTIEMFVSELLTVDEMRKYLRTTEEFKNASEERIEEILKAEPDAFYDYDTCNNLSWENAAEWGLI